MTAAQHKSTALEDLSWDQIVSYLHGNNIKDFRQYISYENCHSGIDNLGSKWIADHLCPAEFTSLSSGSEVCVNDDEMNISCDNTLQMEWNIMQSKHYQSFIDPPTNQQDSVGDTECQPAEEQCSVAIQWKQKSIR